MGGEGDGVGAGRWELRGGRRGWRETMRTYVQACVCASEHACGKVHVYARKERHQEQ